MRLQNKQQIKELLEINEAELRVAILNDTLNRVYELLTQRMLLKDVLIETLESELEAA